MTYGDYRATLERQIGEQFAQLKEEKQTGGISDIVATLSKIVELQRELVRLLSSHLPYIPSPPLPPYYPQPMWWPSYPYPLSVVITESTTTDTGKKKEEH